MLCLIELAQISLARLQEKSVMSCQMFFNLCVPVLRSDKVIRGAYACHQKVTFLYCPHRLQCGCIYCWKTHPKGQFCPSTRLDQAPLALFCLCACDFPGYTASPKGEWDGAPFILIFHLFCAALTETDVGLHIWGIDGVMEAISSYLICRL